MRGRARRGEESERLVRDARLGRRQVRGGSRAFLALVPPSVRCGGSDRGTGGAPAAAVWGPEALDRLPRRDAEKTSGFNHASRRESTDLDIDRTTSLCLAPPHHPPSVLLHCPHLTCTQQGPFRPGSAAQTSPGLLQPKPTATTFQKDHPPTTPTQAASADNPGVSTPPCFFAAQTAGRCRFRPSGPAPLSGPARALSRSPRTLEYVFAIILLSETEDWFRDEAPFYLGRTLILWPPSLFPPSIYKQEATFDQASHKGCAQPRHLDLPLVKHIPKTWLEHSSLPNPSCNSLVPSASQSAAHSPDHQH